MTGFLGKGFEFPVRIDGSGGFGMSEGAEAIAQSIWLILSTAPGERMMRPEFGCRIHEYVFAPNNATTRGALAHFAKEALRKWEPRIKVVDLTAVADEEQPNLVRINIDYRIRSNNASHNMVYPFFLTE